MSAPLIHHTIHPGADPTVVLVHGMACDESDWREQVAFFSARGQRVITVDLRGHGQSSHFDTNLDMTTMGADVAEVLAAHDVRAAVIAGHSMGCRVVTEAALQADGRIGAVVLVDGSRFAKGDPDAAVATVQTAIEQRGFANHMSLMFDAMFLPGADQRMKQTIIDRAAARPEHLGLPIMLAMIRWDAALFEARYGALRAPVHVLQSSHVNESRQRVALTDDMEIPWHADLVDAGVEVAFERVPDCGHFTMLDAPEHVNAVLADVVGTYARHI
ncbi:MAG: alpha/beta hydrolase [Pseudomonadota bacterium]